MNRPLSKADPRPTLALQLLGAADALRAVLQGRSLDEVLAALPAPARPACQALSFHTLRHLAGAQAARAALAPRRPAPEVDALLLTALALLWPQAAPPYPDHTLVDQAVAALRQRQPHAAAFVNAVLRRFLRERATLVPALQAHQPEVLHQHPRWWVDRLEREQGAPAAAAVMAAANRHAPLMLRVNPRRASVEQVCAALAAVGHPAEVVPLPALPSSSPAAGAAPLPALWLARPAPVEALPGFTEGWFSVQDSHAQLAAPLLLGEGADRLEGGAHVLDACAAPGGKTAHLLELAEPDLLALDRDAARLDLARATLDRLGLQARLQAADAAEPARWWDGRPFDAILLDAPCSASGIVRRHPDIRWLRRAADLATLAQQQARLLDALWPTLAPGGRLVYAVCSVFAAEGEHQIEAFLQRRPDARRQPAPGLLRPGADNGPSPAGAGDGGLPSGDGFFYARLDKQA